MSMVMNSLQPDNRVVSVDVEIRKATREKQRNQ